MKTQSMLLVLMVILAGPVGAQNTSDDNLAGRVYDEARETEINQKAQRRLYPGGKDEVDLKVQAQLVAPVRKMTPTGDVPNDSASEAE